MNDIDLFKAAVEHARSVAYWRQRATEASLRELRPFTVYQLLSGKSKGKHGEAHRAAVLLGLKSEGEIVDPQAVRGKLFLRAERRAA